MSQPVTTAPPAASPPRPEDPARGEFRHRVRRILADASLTDSQRETRIVAATDEYAAHMIERHARPARKGGAA